MKTEEQLIEFETAKLVKEKGIEFTSPNFYCEKYGLCELSEESLIVKNPFNIIFDINNEFDEGERFYATTQSLLQSWFRDELNVDVFVVPWFNKEEDYKKYYKVRIICDCRPEYTFNGYASYEEALEKGLFEVLEFVYHEDDFTPEQQESLRLNKDLIEDLSDDELNDLMKEFD